MGVYLLLVAVLMVIDEILAIIPAEQTKEKI